MRPDRSLVLAIAVLLGLGACASGSMPTAAPRPVAALPAAFVVDTAFHAPATRLSADRCVTHLVDPSGLARLELVRSASLAGRVDLAQPGHPWVDDPAAATLVGDYGVIPSGRYGVAASELLRVACGAGVPLGAVRK